MKNIVQIFHVVKIAGKAKATGNEYDMRMAQCMVERLDENGQPAPLIGELVLPEKYKEISPGRYEVEFEVAVSRDKRIGSQVASMTLIPGRQASAAAAAPAPSKA